MSEQTYTGEITEALDAAEEAIEYIGALLEHREDLVAVEAIQTLSHTRRLIAALKAIDSDLVAHIYAVGEYGEQVIDGIGLVKVSRSANRRAWNHEVWQGDVRRTLIHRYGASGGVVADVETGETLNLYDLLRDAMGVQGSGAPKTTALRELDLDPDDYCESSPGSPQVTFQS